MSTVAQSSPVMITQVEQYFAKEGLRQTTDEELEKIPENLRAGIPCIEDHDTPFGTRPPTDGEIASFYDHLAPHYDALLLAQYDLEVCMNSWLLGEIERRSPRLIVDAGCGTGITLTLVLAAFPACIGCGYDPAQDMLFSAKQRVTRVVGHAEQKRWFLMQYTHTGFGAHTRIVSTDLLFTKCSFSAGAFVIPFFDEAPSPSVAREDFYANDLTMTEWRKNLKAFATVLRTGGTYIHIAPLADGVIEALVWLAEDVGFRLITEDPSWFEQRPTPTEKFRAEYSRELAEVGVPVEHHPEAIHRHWNWTAPALGALMFTRR